MTSNNARGGRRYTPYAFTEQVAMLSVCRPRAIAVNIEIMRALLRCATSRTATQRSHESWMSRGPFEGQALSTTSNSRRSSRRFANARATAAGEAPDRLRPGQNEPPQPPPARQAGRSQWQQDERIESTSVAPAASRTAGEAPSDRGCAATVRIRRPLIRHGIDTAAAYIPTNSACRRQESRRRRPSSRSAGSARCSGRR